MLQHHGLAGLGRGHQQAALALADGRNDVDDAAGQVLFGPDVALEDEGEVGVEGGEVFEEDLVLGVFRWLRIDLVHLDQRKVALAVLRRSNLALDRIPGVQIEAPDLARAYVDVVWPGQVGRIGRAEEPEAIRQHLQRPLAEDALALLGLVLQQREDQVLLAHAVGILDLVGVRHLHEFGHVEVLEVG